MARPVWTGSLGFGLVNVPVSLFAATQDKGVHFHQLEEGTADRIRYRRVNERTGEEVQRERIVRGVDLGDGQYVVVGDDELEAIAPERSNVIEITDFVDLAEIDPVYYETTYYLAPRGESAARAYALLRAAMQQTAMVGIAIFVLRGRERLVAVRPDRRVLAMETMYFADEVRDPEKEIPDLPGDVSFGERELKTACMLIESLTAEWRPERYTSTYRSQLDELIERKRHGETIHVAGEAPERRAQIVDLMEALNASLEATRGSRRADGSGTGAGSSDGAQGAAGRETSTSAGRRPQRRRAGGEQRRAGSGRAAGELSTLTKGELMSKAAELGVPGRSKMSRDELEAAVRRASRRRAS